MGEVWIRDGPDTTVRKTLGILSIKKMDNNKSMIFWK
jgi:hypothetical protein